MFAKPEIRVFNTPPELFASAAQQFTQLAGAAVSSRGRFSVALSGGSTPKSLYSLLADHGADIPWDKIFFFWGDERHVPPDHPDSNYRMTQEALLSKVPVPSANIFRVHSENPDAEAAALDYEQTLKKFFELAPSKFPSFDLILLGLGPDAHTASLFPATKALQERSRLVVANWVEKFKTYRITFTLPVLNNARFVTFLAVGKDKAPAVKAVFDETSSPDQFPARMVQPAGSLVWFLDKEAAAPLSQ